MYGQQFVSMWANTNIDEVKALWAEKLGSFTASEFAEALNLMAEKQFPPNLPEFLSFCKTAQRNHQPGWKPEEVERISKAEAEVVMAKIEAKIGKPKPQIDYRGWAKKILDRKASGERVPYVAVKMAESVYRMPLEPQA